MLSGQNKERKRRDDRKKERRKQNKTTENCKALSKQNLGQCRS